MDPPACPEIADSQAVRAMSVLLAGLDLPEREELVDSLALQVVPVSLELRAPRAIPERRVSMAIAAAQFLNYFSDHKSVFSFIRRLPTCHCTHLLLSAVQWISGDHFHLFAFSSPPISRYLLPAWRSAANPQERRAADGPTDT